MQTRSNVRRTGEMGRRHLAVFLLRQAGWRVEAVREAAGIGPGSVGVYVTRARGALDRGLGAG